MMIKKILHQYRSSIIKRQIINDLALSICCYCIIMLLCILSEIIFYHPMYIRYKFFIFLTLLPAILISYIIIKTTINLLKINPNMNDEVLAKELGQKIPKLSDQILNALQLSKKKFNNQIKKALSEKAIKSIESKIQRYSLENFIPKISLYTIATTTIFFSTTLIISLLV